MEKENLILNLKEKLGDDKSSMISDRTFGDIAEQYESQFSDDAAITEDSWKAPLAILASFAGQKRHDEKVLAEKLAQEHNKSLEEKITLAKEQAIEEYKRSLVKPEPKPVKEEGDVKSAVDAYIGSLMAEDGVLGKMNATMSKFMESFTKQQEAEKLSQVKAQVKAHLETLGASNAAVIDDVVNGIAYKAGMTPEDAKVSAKADYEARFKRYYGDGAKPFGGKSQHEDGKEINDAIKRHIENLKSKAEQQQAYKDTLSKTFV